MDLSQFGRRQRGRWCPGEGDLRQGESQLREGQSGGEKLSGLMRSSSFWCINENAVVDWELITREFDSQRLSQRSS